MIRTRKLVSVIGATATVAGLAVVAAGGSAGASPVPRGYQPLPGSVAPFATHTRVMGSVPGSERLTVQVWLRPQLGAAARFATAVSTPGSRLFHHYLSPAGYTARFGATAGEASSVESWLRAKGFATVHTDAGRDFVRATATAATVNAAFHTQLKLYRASGQLNAGRYPLRANDRPVYVPASLAGSVLGVTGLDNAAPILPLERQGTHAAGKPKVPCSHYYGQHTTTVPKHFGSTTFSTAGCGYSATQERSAYGASGFTAGKGQTVALVELGLTQDMFLTLQDYAAHNGMPAPTASHYREISLGNNSCGDPFFIEEQLDVETAYNMAPGANELVMGGDGCAGDFGLQGLFDADTAILNGVGGHPLATIASNSWESGDEDQPGFWNNIENAYLVRAAGEGVGMYFSSGDGSGTEMPSSDPFATAVGGTTLGIGKTGSRLFETGWSTDLFIDFKGQLVNEGEDGAAGGGPSLLWKEPSYQDGVVPAALTNPSGNRGGHVRSVPDISAEADLFTGVSVGYLNFNPKKPFQPPTYHQFVVGGTSVAAPLVAGFVTAAQQGQASPFGFINPALYKLAGTSAFTDTLPLTSKSPALWRGVACPRQFCGLLGLATFDSQSKSMFGYTGQVTLKGYDNMSGLGVPNGQNFINALRAAH